MDSRKTHKPPNNCKMEKKYGDLGNRSKKATSVEYYYNNYFPVEILFEIFLRLPLKCLIRCCRVCKSWCSLIKSSAFIAIHLSRSSLIPSNHKTQNDGFDQLLLINQGNNFYSLYYGDNPNPNPNPKPAFQCACSGLNVPLVVKFGVPARMVGTCNGVTCPSWYPRGGTIIWNPSVRNHTHTPFAVEVYSLARGSWKSLGAAVLPGYGKLGGVSSKSVLVNGTLHWVQLRDKEEQEHGQQHINVMSFDLSTELFGEIMMPEALRKRGSNCVFLKYGLTGRLLYIHHNNTLQIKL
ncbi:putative F-box protein At5g52610 [Pyrus communis]|uniref:putative F-box protein At5g52610 n=1 Tax=Pyrus communis TaxID=23211 RepID=UPI0035BFBB75